MTDLGQHDPFADVSAWNDSTAATWVARLDDRAAAPDQERLRAEVLARAELLPGETVVEVGCGTGVFLRELARAVEPGGRAIGIEPQPVLAAAARERAGVEVVEAFGEQLPLETGSADAALTQTVLIHLPLEAVRATLAEMARVVRPEGRVLAVEQDADTWTIDHPDRGLTRRIVAFNADQRSADGWRGRQLRALFTEAGLETEVWPYVHADTEPGSYLFALAERIALAAAEAGALSQAEAESWLAQLRLRTFFSTINYYICSGNRRLLDRA